MLLDSLKPESAAAVWSAVAASFSALTAYLSWRAQVRTLHHSFRPEIVVANWTRASGPTETGDQLFFSTIKNTGRDTARQIIVHASGKADDERLTYVSGNVNVAGLVAGEQVTVDGRIILLWSHVPKHGTLGKLLSITVKVWSWDALGIRHTTKLLLLVMESAEAQLANAVCLAPGVFLQSQTTESVPVFRLKILNAIGRIPLLGRLARSDV